MFMKKTLTTLLLVLLAGISAHSQSITVDGKQRSYIVYAPKNLGEDRPMLISCHGASQDANYMKNTQMKMEAVADSAKFLIVFPNGIDNQWDISGDRDINLILALIDKMVTQYKIDRNRVYLSGFSMGGMLTYHAMNMIADRIAAFAPISGYPLWGSSANSSRPVPILHTQGLADDVCSPDGVRGVLTKWVQRNHCNTTPTVTKNYRGYGHATMTIWGGGDEGTEVRLLELAGKGHWVSNDGLITGEEIWNFCKRYSLDMKEPSVKIVSPTGSLTFLTLGGASQTGTIDIEATASDPDGKIVKAALYDGDNLIEEQTKKQQTFTFSIASLDRGTHQLRVVVTDDEGLTGQASLTINVEEPTTNYVFTKVFDTEGSVAQGWQTYDGKEQRTGYSDGYTQGCRVFHFTGEEHDFEWGLYVRNMEGRPGEGYARFAAPETSTKLMLYPGNYLLLHRLANWNIPDFSPIRIAVERIDGTAVFEEEVTPTVNIGNNAANSFHGATMGSTYFDIHELGQYQITFYTADSPWADAVVGQAALRHKGLPVGIEEAAVEQGTTKGEGLYDLTGRRIEGNGNVMARGLYIKEGKKYLRK